MMSPARVAVGNNAIAALGCVVAAVPPWLIGKALARCVAVTWYNVFTSTPV